MKKKIKTPNKFTLKAIKEVQNIKKGKTKSYNSVKALIEALDK